MGRDAAEDAAFTEFAAASRARLRATAYLLCGDWERASDHVQEGLIRVYVAWPRMVRRGSEFAYARKAVVSASSTPAGSGRAPSGPRLNGLTAPLTKTSPLLSSTGRF